MTGSVKSSSSSLSGTVVVRVGEADVVEALVLGVVPTPGVPLTLGVVPGARIGARIALGVRERRLRVAVGLFLLAVAVAYGVAELTALAGDDG